MPETLPEQYRKLVSLRKECRLCVPALTNPAVGEAGTYDSAHIGPWSSWHGKFNPELMIIGQDWGDTNCFRRQRGREDPNSPTNKILTDLVRLIGLEMDAVFLTNAILCLKEGGLQAPVKQAWFRNCGERFLKPTIEIVNPRVLVTMGECAYRSVEVIFCLPHVAFKDAVSDVEGFMVFDSVRLFPVYHCSPRILNTHRRWPKQQEDWARIRRALPGQSVG